MKNKALKDRISRNSSALTLTLSRGERGLLRGPNGEFIMATNQPGLKDVNEPTRLTWRATLLMVGVVSLVRLLYLVFLSPYELVADEAQYWDWSRRLDLCYYSKGPGIAWLIACSTRLLGHSEWTVRLPAVLCGAVAALLVARLAMQLAKGDSRAGFYAAALFLLTPAYQATSMLMTIDAPLLVFWALALLAMAHVTTSLHRWSEHSPKSVGTHDDHPSPTITSSVTASSVGVASTKSAWGWWVLLGLALGVGMLFKYTMLLILPGVLVFVVLRRRSLRWNPRAVMGAALAGVILAVCALPVVIWNHRHDWPTYRHLLGNIELPGGDRSPSQTTPVITTPAPATPTTAPVAPKTMGEQLSQLVKQPAVRRVINPIEFVVVQMALVGPGVILLWVGVRQGWQQRWRDGRNWSVRFMLICTAGGVLVFYAVISLMHQVEGNWPIAAYVGLIALAGAMLCEQLPRYRELVAQWYSNTTRPRPRMGYLRRQPETAAQIGWHWAIAYGLIAGVGMMLLVPLAQLPGLKKVIPVHRLTAGSALADLVQRGMTNAKLTTDHPIIVTGSYGETALLAFYLPGQPVVYTAMSYLGGRKSSYDFFADTNLADLKLVGKPMVLVTTEARPWRMVFGFGNLRQVEPPAVTEFKKSTNEKPKPKVYVAEAFLGPLTRGDTTGR